MRGELGRYFALGTTSKRRGYYFAYPVRHNNRIIGAVVIQRVIESKRYPGTRIDSEPLFQYFEPLNEVLNRITIDKTVYLHLKQPMKEARWQVHLLTPVKQITQELFLAHS